MFAAEVLTMHRTDRLTDHWTDDHRTIRLSDYHNVLTSAGTILTKVSK